VRSVMDMFKGQIVDIKEAGSESKGAEP
jgi:hypothetical protein